MKSLSQAGQDIFAQYINKNVQRGFFLDLGCNEPFKYNNTALLEDNNWTGILVDYMPELISICSSHRKSKCICADLKVTSLTDILDNNNSPQIIDYISMDLDYDVALNSIKTLDVSKYIIRSLTFEHDYYCTKSTMMEESRDYLESIGLKIVCKNVNIFDNSPFEDWYINPDLVSENVYNPIICENLHYINIVNKIKEII